VVTWDEPKRLANLERHGLDFAAFEEGFSWDDHVVLPTDPSRTGRIREQLIGLLDGELMVSAIRPSARLRGRFPYQPPPRQPSGKGPV
jgi:uncharacterized protein